MSFIAYLINTSKENQLSEFAHAVQNLRHGNVEIHLWQRAHDLRNIGHGGVMSSSRRSFTGHHAGYTDRGAEGAMVVITGARFSSNTQNNVVRFNGLSAAITAAATDQLIVVVPPGATTVRSMLLPMVTPLPQKMFYGDWDSFKSEHIN